MCGVWTRARFDQKITPEELVHPLASLRHRGPDGFGWWANDQLAMVHTRLSIIDIAGGVQPLISADRRWIGIVNGELYDYEHIREQLQAQGVQFQTRSDSEVLLNLYAREGAAGLRKVSGEFAFIFFDQNNNELHYGRDPFGVKPLFFEARDNMFTLSSEMKALSSEKPQLSQEYMRTFLGHMIVPPQTCLENVQHVWPGRVHRLNLNTRELTWENYYQLPLFQGRKLTGPEALENLENELRASVKRRLRADVEVGAYLSGGIDSALITALAADQGAKVKTFTVGFVDRDFDETAQAAEIAQDLGLSHSSIHLNSKNFMRSLIDSIKAFENPIANPHGAAKNLLALHASSQVKVVLTGEGADEWFGGYAYLRIQKLQNFVQRHPRFAHNAMDLFMDREMGRSLNHLDGGSTEFVALANAHFSELAPALLGRLPKRRSFRHLTGHDLKEQVSNTCLELAAQLKAENPHAKLNLWDVNTWMALRTDLLHYILSNVGDRQEMAHGIEGRTPFLDQKLAQSVAQVREDFLIRGLTEKYPLRVMAKKYLKNTHTTRGKKPFFAPMKYMYLRENREVVRQMIDYARVATPWLNWKNIDHLLYNQKRATSSPLESSVAGLRLTLFSTGVIAHQLRDVQNSPAIQDVLSSRRSF